MEACDWFFTQSVNCMAIITFLWHPLMKLLHADVNKRTLINIKENLHFLSATMPHIFTHNFSMVAGINKISSHEFSMLNSALSYLQYHM